MPRTVIVLVTALMLTLVFGPGTAASPDNLGEAGERACQHVRYVVVESRDEERVGAGAHAVPAQRQRVRRPSLRGEPRQENGSQHQASA